MWRIEVFKREKRALRWSLMILLPKVEAAPVIPSELADCSVCLLAVEDLQEKGKRDELCKSVFPRFLSFPCHHYLQIWQLLAKDPLSWQCLCKKLASYSAAFGRCCLF